VIGRKARRRTASKSGSPRPHGLCLARPPARIFSSFGWPARPAALRVLYPQIDPVGVLIWAEATVIDAGNAPYDVVQIVARNVSFGDVGKGFSLIHAGTDGNGNGGDGLALLAGPARVKGNIATANSECGFDLVPGGESLYGHPSNFWAAMSLQAMTCRLRTGADFAW
jgi:hypothetical protein